MTAEDLKEALKFEARKIKEYRERIEHLRDGAVLSRGVAVVPARGSAGGDKVSWAVGEIDRLEKLMQAHIDRVCTFTVLCNNPEQREVIRLRYIEGLRIWKDVADASGYSMRNTQYIHDSAIALICEKMQTLL